MTIVVIGSLRVKTGTIFSLPDKRLFQISEVEMTIVDCSVD